MWVIIGGVVAIVVVLAIGTVAMVQEGREWQAFASAHHCQVVGRMQGSTDIAPIISSKGGVAVTTTPDKTAYKCDDGVTYWRND